MSNRTEIQAAICELPPEELVAIKKWLRDLTPRQLGAEACPPPDLVWTNPEVTPDDVATWLKQSIGVAAPGVTTDSIMAMTREA